MKRGTVNEVVVLGASLAMQAVRDHCERGGIDLPAPGRMAAGRKKVLLIDMETLLRLVGSFGRLAPALAAEWLVVAGPPQVTPHQLAAISAVEGVFVNAAAQDEAPLLLRRLLEPPVPPQGMGVPAHTVHPPVSGHAGRVWER